MGIWATIFGGAAAAPIEAIGNVVDKLFTSDEERLDKKIIMERLKQQPGLAQVEVNKVQAQHRSIWVAGGRPAIMWVCAFALFNQFLINPWLQWIFHRPGPDLNAAALMDLVIALLGLGTLRTVEKLNNKTK